MTTEEKLQNFYNHSLDSANREAERVIGDHQKALDKIFEEHKATARRQAEEEVAAETEKAKRDVNKTLSADQLHIRRKLSRKNLELKKFVKNLPLIKRIHPMRSIWSAKSAKPLHLPETTS